MTSILIFQTLQNTYEWPSLLSFPNFEIVIVLENELDFYGLSTADNKILHDF